MLMVKCGLTSSVKEATRTSWPHLKPFKIIDPSHAQQTWVKLPIEDGTFLNEDSERKQWSRLNEFSWPQSHRIYRDNEVT